MNDDFIHLLYESPRPEFAQTLYTKLQREEKDRSTVQPRVPIGRLVMIPLVILGLILLTIGLVPSARVMALSVVNDIIAQITVRGVTVFVNDDPPATQMVSESESYAVVWRPLSPEEITHEHPFFAKLPTWIPVGYTLQDRAALYYTSTIETPPHSALFQWEDELGGLIQLEVLNGSCLNGEFHDPDGEFKDRRSDCTLAMFISIGPENQQQVLMVHGQPAVFLDGVLGIADLSGTPQTWNPSRWKSVEGASGMTMIWESDGRTYVLIAVSGSLPQEDMLRLAESIP